ncbi:hypothetical protein SBA1_440041 [Candidatus Sulfotelmatobacter kueseliae]|uniref:Uncharacterized protein n=1 Tax=Candidatus Sulfotelmatobacter kueseliae TaxID=2042962 RepID=A0A2U3KRP7_9BACT|nr:hypothetical protein SBA1_440041 [Candidatus Sulfotelmatobacter kueseliae]
MRSAHSSSSRPGRRHEPGVDGHRTTTSLLQTPCPYILAFDHSLVTGSAGRVVRLTGSVAFSDGQ